MSEFLTDFINHSLSKGRYTSEDMCSLAREQIKEIEIEIDKLNDLKVKKNQLLVVIKQLSGKEETNSYKDWDFSIPADQLSEDHLELCDSICLLLENKDICMSDIFGSLNKYEESSQVVYAVKWLSGRNIILKDGTKITKGSKWNERPKLPK